MMMPTGNVWIWGNDLASVQKWLAPTRRACPTQLPGGTT